MGGGISKDQRRADLARLEGRNLLVDRADAGAFLVVQDGKADRARHVIFGEFGRAAHVDDGIGIGGEELVEGKFDARHGAQV